MAASKKKKRDKGKDFQKPKLKVGKTKPKATNSTDTSFIAKSIKLKSQSISIEAPSQSTQFSHHLSLLHHKNYGQVTDSLAFLTKTLEVLGSDSRIPLPISELLPKILFLTNHESQRVREQFIKLLEALPSEDVVSTKLDVALLWTRSGMTHMAIDIRSSSLDILAWLVKTAPGETVALPGGWYNTINDFVILLGWQKRDNQSGGWTRLQNPLNQNLKEAALRAKQISALASFLKAGIDPPPPRTGEVTTSFPLWQPERHMLSYQTGFAHLNIFGNTRSVKDEAYTDRKGRQGVLGKYFLQEITKGLVEAKRQGGQLGRAASTLEKAIDKGMADAEELSASDSELDV